MEVIMEKPAAEQSNLVLGWQVTPTLEPQYWLDSGAKAGSQKAADLVCIPAKLVGGHTAIIAQSGSGKSFFLGRFVEELMLQTRAKCVILDPNADFRRVDEVESTKLWKSARYNLQKREGKLPHEAKRGEFKARWSSVRIVIRTKTIGYKHKNRKALKLWWPFISVDFFSEDSDAELRSQIYHCHAFVQAVQPLIALTKEPQPADLIKKSEELFVQTIGHSEEQFRAVLEKELKVNFDKLSKKQLLELGFPFSWPSFGKLFARAQITRLIQRALTAAKYVTEEGKRYYFSRAQEYNAAGILITGARQPPPQTHSSRLEVIDLPSLPDKATRLLAINATLATEWSRVRKAWSVALEKAEDEDTRVPTFIVVDEAHNLIPAEPQSKAEFALRDQFRTIVAEGRKYGLFLVLVSQRPDKLDPQVLSECENKALMKLSSRTVLEMTRSLMGLEDVPEKLLDKCMDFEIGRVLLSGSWTPAGPVFLYSATRRTSEGGRNLRKKYWALPAAKG